MEQSLIFVTPEDALKVAEQFHNCTLNETEVI